MELSRRLAVSGDLPPWCAAIAAILGAVSLICLVVELTRTRRGGAVVFGTGALSIAIVLAAILRPVRVSARESSVGARVVVLADVSRSMALADQGTTRAEVRDRALAALAGRSRDARLAVLGFGDGPARPLAGNEGRARAGDPRSDLAFALRSVAESPDERPKAIVVVSDGQLDDPPEGASRPALAAAARTVGVPIHTIATTRRTPKDASVRRASTAGAAVAHVPVPIRVEVACGGGLDCDKLTVTAKELREDGPPALLASGIADVTSGKAVVDLTVTMERAGARIVEIAIGAPQGDEIRENDRRLLALGVVRERVRVLHVAGRATQDVRALRRWLKQDASVDLVAFFILRTPADNPQADPDDLALIRFPVDELFDTHLPSFDAVVLQDFDAQPYGLVKHLPSLSRYVRHGGGLIMVGGPNSFVAGGYAGTPLAEVLPVELDGSANAEGADVAPLVPAWTQEGAAARLLGPLRGVVGDELPEMPGANVLGTARAGALVLWTHPTRRTRAGTPMPVLAVGDQGDGRSIALAVDGAWLLDFSPLGARTAARAHGALWDGMLGWLMRDPRFEPAQVDVPGGCVAGEPVRLRVRSALHLQNTRITTALTRLDASMPRRSVETTASGETATVELGSLDAGGYSARLSIGEGLSTRHDFACEAGGDEWADSRPDGARLRELAAAAGGTFAFADGPIDVPVPPPTVINAERHVTPALPAWVWAFLAASTLGTHWLVRRRGGLA